MRRTTNFSAFSSTDRILLLVALCTLALLAAAVSAAVVSDEANRGGAVHRIKARHEPLRLPHRGAAADDDDGLSSLWPPQHRHHPHLENHRLSAATRKHIKAIRAAAAAANSGDGIGHVRVNNAHNFALIGTVHIGTPPQEFDLDFNFFYGSTYVVDTDASVSKYLHNGGWPKHRYNASKSSTYSNVDGQHFTLDFHEIKGHEVNDVIEIDKLSFPVRFGDVDSVGFASWLHGLPIDGVFGMSPSSDGSYDNISVIYEIADKLKNPIVSVYSHRPYDPSVDGPGTAQITVGDVDTDTCAAANYIYAPQTDDYWGVHLNRMRLGKKVFNPKHSIAILFDDTFTEMLVTKRMFAMFVKASGAVYNTDYKVFTVDCNKIYQAQNVTFLVGSDGNEVAWTIIGADYITYYAKSNYCYLNLNPKLADDTSEGVILLNRQFLNNHCLAHNLKTGHIGVARVGKAVEGGGGGGGNGGNGGGGNGGPSSYSAGSHSESAETHAAKREGVKRVMPKAAVLKKAALTN
jgi:hypothetical protein